MAVEIADWNDLDNVRNDLTGDYVLVNDLDSETDGYAGIGDDFKRIATRDSPFSGNFDGASFSIQDFILGDDGENFRGHGLFSHVGDGGLVENLSISGVVDVTNFTADTDFFTSSIAGLVADSGAGTIQNCVSHVDVTASNNRVGGLVGENQDTVTQSYATGSVEANEQVGGLVGYNEDGTVTESHATGSVEGDSDVGGLLGDNFGGEVTESYATGSVEGDGNRVGGLVGRNLDTITESYATGSVEGGNEVGGLVGFSSSGSSIDKTYSLSDVTGSDVVGGLYGKGFTADVSESYAVGNVTGDTNVGGFAGDSGDGDRERNYFDTEATTQSDAFGTSDGGGGVTSLTTSEMQGDEAETNMDGFDFANTWDSVLESDDDTSADGYPILLAVDREQQLDAQGILSLIAFTASALVNSESVEIQDTFAQVNDEVREVTEVFALINGSVEQI